MTFQLLIMRTPWSDVEQALSRLIPEVGPRLPGLQQAYDILGKLPPKPSNYRARFHWHPDDEIYPFSLCLLNGTRYRDGPSPESWPEHMQDEEVEFGLGLPWELFLALTPPAEALTQVSSADLLAWCLWELSWFGYTPEDCEENMEDFQKALEEADAGPWKKLDIGPVGR